MRAIIAVLIAAAVFVAGCSRDTVEVNELEDPAEFVSEQLDAEDSAVTSQPAQAVANPGQTTLPPNTATATDMVGVVINQFLLRLGDCFNRFEDIVAGQEVVTTSLIGCELPHDHQIYHLLDYPAPFPSIYPGEEVMNDFAIQSCYRNFADWVGRDYETSGLDIGVIVPTRSNFEDEVARYRTIHCWVERVDGEPIVGDAHQTAW